jgi:hypothetical protein
MASKRRNVKDRGVALDGGDIDYGTEGFVGAAVQLLSDAALKLRLAAFALDDEQEEWTEGTFEPFEAGMVTGALDLLALQVEGMATQARRLRKRVREV